MPHPREGVERLLVESAGEHIVTRALTVHQNERVETLVARLIGRIRFPRSHRLWRQYLADAIGTQTEAIVVPGLSLSRLSLRKWLADELRSSLSFPIVAVAFGSLRLAVSTRGNRALSWRNSCRTEGNGAEY